MTRLTIPFNTGESITVDPTVDPEFCAHCGRVPATRLTLEVEVDGKPFTFAIGRECLSEHTPRVLDELEKAAGLTPRRTT